MSASASVLPMNIQGKFPLQDIPFSGFDHLAVQGTLKSLLYHNLKATIRQRAAFFMVQHPHTTTGKTIALTVQTFVGKVMSLFFNTLSRLSKPAACSFAGANARSWEGLGVKLQFFGQMM